MSDATSSSPRPALGVGQIVGDTFSIVMKRLPAILLLAFIPALVQSVLNYLLIGQSASQLESGGTTGFGGFIVGFLSGFVISLVIGSIVTAAIVQLSYDTKLDHPSRIGYYIATAVRNLPAIIVLSIAVTILYSLGFALLIIPGLWLCAVFSVFVPAIVIEGQGFGSLRRSAELTRDYRWPIVGALFLVIVCVFLIGLIGGFLAAVIANAFSASPFIALVSEALWSAIGYGLISVTVALIFARLKEIKEGVGVSDLVEVFR